VNTKKINVGLVGCGRISERHFSAYATLKDKINIQAVCDQDATKLDRATEVTGAKGYADFQTMLESEKLDLLAITTPNAFHAPQIITAASYVKNIVTEKPMAIKWQDGLMASQECEKKGVGLFVIYQNRFNATIQAVHKAIKTGRFGKIYMITSNVFWQRPQAYYDKDATWHGTKDVDGGAYFTQASHYIDLMQWFAGSTPKTVYANLSTLARKIETEDSGIVTIEWADGTLGNLNLTVLTYPKNLEGSMTILGEKGTVKIGGVALNSVDTWDFADQQPEDEAIKSLNYNTASVYGNGHVDNYENIIKAIHGSEPALIDGKEGLKSVKILTALYESSRLKKPIEL
jgi:UDP-N-acetyl-2-amino-2-deoxyglucuronate dehydrogenase